MSRLALFDLDGTLVDRQASYARCLQELCDQFAYGPEVEAWLVRELEQRADRADFVRLRAAFRLVETADQLWKTYVGLMASAVACCPQTREGLVALRAAGWTIGVVTNGAADIQRAKLEATGLAPLVDGVAVSGDIEVRKPDALLFALAGKRCGADLADGWMCGDSPTADIVGARNVGLRSIWLRGRPWPDDLAPAHHVVDDVTGAIALLLNQPRE